MNVQTKTIATMLAIIVTALLIASPAAVAQNGEKVAVEPVKVNLGRSQVIQAPWPVSKVSIAEPKIADVQVATPNQVVVLAQSTGTTDLVMWNEKGEMYRATVRVEADLAELRKDLTELFPTGSLRVSESQGVIVVSGVLRRAEDTARLAGFMEKAGIKYADMTSLAGLQQVMISVRVAEANRLALRSLGVNMLHGKDDFFGGQVIGGNANGVNIGVPGGASATGDLPFGFNSPTSIGSAVTLFTGFPAADLEVFVEALEDNRYMRILAEPTLVALSGEEASFLAGGEFPIPVSQTTGEGVGSAITVEFKEFGVRLRFRPTVLGDGSIRMKIAPEVSQLSDIGAVELQGFSIPAITTRRAETTLEMKSGQTFALAGLIDQSTAARSEKVPGLGSVPVLGTLFRSVRYQQEDTELVVLATVSLVEPLSDVKGRPVPGDLHDSPSAWELYMNGSIEGRTPAKVGPANREWLQEHGLDRLKGPGAWESYGDRPQRPVPGAPAPVNP